MYSNAEDLQNSVNAVQALLSRTTVWIQTDMSLEKTDTFMSTSDEYMKHIDEILTLLEGDLGIRNDVLMQQLRTNMGAYKNSLTDVVEILKEEPYDAVTVLSDTYEVFDELAGTVQETEKYYENIENTLHVQSLDSQQRALVHVVGVSIIALVASLIVAAICGHAVSSPIRSLARVVARLAEGDIEVEVSHTEQRNEVGIMASSIEHLKLKLQEAARLERESQVAANNSRIRQALGSASTSLVVADNEGQAIFVNEGMKRLLNKVGSAFSESVRHAISGGDELLNLQQLQVAEPHCDLTRLAAVDISEFELEGLMLKQMITPVLDADGIRNGLILEWIDLSDQFEREATIQAASARELELAEDLKIGADKLLLLVDAALEGDLTQRVTIEGNGAMSQISSALGGLFDNLSVSISAISNNAAQLNASSGEISELNQSMNNSATAASKQIAQVTEASSEVSDHVSEVSLLLSDMNASITEVSDHSENATSVAGKAVDIAQSTDALVRQLSESSGEISVRINAIQRDSDGAVIAIGEISEIISQINQLQDCISTGITKQKHAVAHISRSTSETDVSTSAIAGNLSQVSASSTETLDGTVKALAAAKTLKCMSASMHELASRFRIRPAPSNIEKAAY